jgi:hypothetical protein
MSTPNLLQYQKNFKTGIQYAQAKYGFDTLVQLSEWLGVSFQTMHKLFALKQFPTVEHGIVLCKKAGFNANWLFLNEGEMFKEYQVTLIEVRKVLEGKPVQEKKLKKASKPRR